VVGEWGVLEGDPHPGRLGVVGQPVESLAQHRVVVRDTDVVDTQDRCRLEHVCSHPVRVNPNPTYLAAATASMRVRIGIVL
jgi:hypothetical protein